MAYPCPNPECGSTNTAITYNHFHNNHFWSTVRDMTSTTPPEPDPLTGLPKPIDCPDGLVDGGGTQLDGPGFSGCGPNSVPASSLFCYDCGTSMVFGPPPLD